MRIRNFLLASPTTRVSELRDHRFVALKATDDQEIAISVFRREDLTALPVTDSSGVLIGIVTVDDVLDVAEAEATEDIQKIGARPSTNRTRRSLSLAWSGSARAGSSSSSWARC